MWFSPLTSWLISLVTVGVPWLKEKTTKSVPAEYWGNKDLYYKDLMDGIPAKQRIKNLENGKYKQTAAIYPEPHRDSDGKIIVENCKLYNEDLMKYGAIQTEKWVRQGKYNLTPEELKKEEERIKAKYKYLYSL